jgi:hypothetical protein
MLCGLPLSWKTTYSYILQKRTGFPRRSLDEEYFAVVGNTQQEHRDFDLERRIEERMKLRVIGMIKEGKSVILDYCPWHKSRRDEYKRLIERNNGTRILVYFPEKTSVRAKCT